MNTPYDITIALSVVHGGAYHALIRFQEMLLERGLKSRLLLGASPPLGLQEGIDFGDAERDRLAQSGVTIMTDDAMLEEIRRTRSRLFLFDGYACPFNEQAVALADEAHGATTMQMGLLPDDFRYFGADYAVLQHPLTLWFTMEYYCRHTARNLHNVRSISFAGNLQYEPLANIWTSAIRTREDFCASYGLDASKPIALWLPDQEDGGKQVYGDVINAVRSAGCNLVVKMHPWEYKRDFKSPWGDGVTSAAKWNVPAIAERDATWARKFCDVAVISGSTSGMELALWHKPVIYVDPVFWCAEFVRGCAVRLRDADGLEGALDKALKKGVDEGAFARTRQVYMPRDGSFDLHVACVERALENGKSGPRMGTQEAVKALYKGRVPWWLKQPGRGVLKTWRQLVG